MERVEIVVELERRFGITIHDHELSSTMTVGNVIELVESKPEVSDDAPCATAHVALRLGTLLKQRLRRQRRCVPRERIADVMPLADRRHVFHRLAAAHRWRMPPLRRHGGVVYVASIILALLAGAILLWVFDAVLMAQSAINRVTVPLLGLVMLAALGALAVVLTRPMAVLLPRGVCTVGDLSRSIVALNVGRIASRLGAVRSDVLQAVTIDVIADVLQCDRNEIKPHASLTADLGMG